MNLNLVKFIPAGTQRILEIGCADGSLGEHLLKQGVAQEVIGIELLPEAAAQARTKLSQVFCENAETFKLPVPEKTFDCLLYGDSLEHLHDPLALLSYHCSLLKDNGCVVCSIPNVRNLFIIDQLLHGRWTYTDWGLFDRTHFHLFTLHEIAVMFQQAGLRIETLEFSFRPANWFTMMYPAENIRTDFLNWYDQLQNQLSSQPDVVINALKNKYNLDKEMSMQEAAEFFAVQFHLRAVKQHL